MTTKEKTKKKKRRNEDDDEIEREEAHADQDDGEDEEVDRDSGDEDDDQHEDADSEDEEESAEDAEETPTIVASFHEGKSPNVLMLQILMPQVSSLISSLSMLQGQLFQLMSNEPSWSAEYTPSNGHAASTERRKGKVGPFQSASLGAVAWEMASAANGASIPDISKAIAKEGGVPAYILRKLRSGGKPPYYKGKYRWKVDDAKGRIKVSGLTTR